jgi:hypothetical protein
MNDTGLLPLIKTARCGRLPKDTARESVVRKRAAVGTLTRTKRLLLAALRVWELKRRISE